MPLDASGDDAPAGTRRAGSWPSELAPAVSPAAAAAAVESADDGSPAPPGTPTLRSPSVAAGSAVGEAAGALVGAALSAEVNTTSAATDPAVAPAFRPRRAGPGAEAVTFTPCTPSCARCLGIRSPPVAVPCCRPGSGGSWALTPE